MLHVYSCDTVQALCGRVLCRRDRLLQKLVYRMIPGLLESKSRERNLRSVALSRRYACVWAAGR